MQGRKEASSEANPRSTCIGSCQLPLWSLNIRHSEPDGTVILSIENFGVALNTAKPDAALGLLVPFRCLQNSSRIFLGASLVPPEAFGNFFKFFLQAFRNFQSEVLGSFSGVFFVSWYFQSETFGNFFGILLQVRAGLPDKSNFQPLQYGYTFGYFMSYAPRILQLLTLQAFISKHNILTTNQLNVSLAYF